MSSRECKWQQTCCKVFFFPWWFIMAAVLCSNLLQMVFLRFKCVGFRKYLKLFVTKPISGLFINVKKDSKIDHCYAKHWFISLEYYFGNFSKKHFLLQRNWLIDSFSSSIVQVLFQYNLLFFLILCKTVESGLIKSGWLK